MKQIQIKIIDNFCTSIGLTEYGYQLYALGIFLEVDILIANTNLQW